MLEECLKYNWDGYGAKPLDHRSILHCLQFIKDIPCCFSKYGIAAEPTGTLCLEWWGNDYYIIAGFELDGKIAWNGCIGNDHVHGEGKEGLMTTLKTCVNIKPCQTLTNA